MKKFLSSLLICATLFCGITPSFFCSAETKKVITIKISPKNSKLDNLDNEDFKKVFLKALEDKSFKQEIFEKYKAFNKSSFSEKSIKFIFKSLLNIIKKILGLSVSVLAVSKLIIYICNKSYKHFYDYLTQNPYFNSIITFINSLSLSYFLENKNSPDVI